MSAVSLASRRRGKLEWAAIIGLPILFNIALAAYLLSQLETGPLPFLGNEELPAEVVGSAEDALPEPSHAEILAAVRESTGSDYECERPWRAAGGVTVWTCRTDDAVAIAYGIGRHSVFQLDVTWFGFDESRTELSDWAAAAFGPSPRREEARRWVEQHIGSSAQTELDGVTLQIGGAEGARALIVRGG